jgi:protein-tyrosine phosphatase
VTASLPEPREPGLYRLALVCLGNICRSPMAHVVLEAHLAGAGLDDRVHVRSAGTGGWHVGEPMDRRAAATLAGAGYDPSGHRGQQFSSSWYDELDLVLAMDTSNLEDLSGLLPSGTRTADGTGPARLARFRDFDPLAGDPGDPDGPDGPGDRDVPDPYYGADDGFATVLAMVERTSEALTALLERTLAPGPSRSTTDTVAPPSA